ncbi:MAG: hypothetical protein DRN35_04990 [Thermoplasmata archaeon]|nr:MAG: hypothetical protein DRN28_03265 [Thermoplasmata archaeon]RLF70027.1 MAG: hypothetical protein DRN35_04990 [Thermoplasmata archaeon]RLF76297.1 MAG: hypothetical protein DRN42_01340 [Thermoplasmata archaeon]
MKDNGNVKRLLSLINTDKLMFLLISLALLLALFFFPPLDVIKTTREISLWVLSIVIALYIFNLFTKAYRWHILLAANGWCGSFLHTAKIFIVIMAINNITPGSLGGEPLRMYLAGRKTNLSAGVVSSTILIEKSLDLTILSGEGILGVILVFPFITSHIYYSVLTTLVILFVFWGLFLYHMVAGRGDGPPQWFRERLIKRGRMARSTLLRKLYLQTDKFVNDLYLGSRAYGNSRKSLSSTLILTLLIWSNEALRVFILAEVLGINRELYRLDSIIGMALLSSSAALLLGVFLPGGVGHALTIGGIYALTTTSVTRAMTIGLLSTLTSTWVCIAIGFILLLCEKGKREKRVSKRS